MHCQPAVTGQPTAGNPLAAKVALSVLETLLADGFLDGVKKRGEEFMHHLHKINDDIGCFAEIRGRGLLLGCDLKEPFSAKDLAMAALDEGLIVITAGTNTLRLAPCLNISDAATEKGFVRLHKAAQKVIAATSAG